MPTQTNLMGSGCAALQAQASVGLLSNSSNSLTATGASQITALAIPSDFDIFTTVAPSTGAILPAAGSQNNPADSYIIVNHGANPLSLYPPAGGKIANGTVNVAFSVPANKTAFMFHIGFGNYAASLSS